MISWWWIPIILMAGAMIGAVIMGVCAANNVNKNRDGKRWWEDE